MNTLKLLFASLLLPVVLNTADAPMHQTLVEHGFPSSEGGRQ